MFLSFESWGARARIYEATIDAVKDQTSHLAQLDQTISIECSQSST